MLFLSQNEVIATQSTETMSLPLTSMSVVTTFLWVVYGVLQWDFYVIVSPACACPDVGQGWSRGPVLNTHGVVPPLLPPPPAGTQCHGTTAGMCPAPPIHSLLANSAEKSSFIRQTHLIII